MQKHQNSIKIENSMKAVYTYFLPEVRELLYKVQSQLTAEMFSNSICADHAEKVLNDILTHKVLCPSTPDGKLDLDLLHEPLLKRLISCFGSQVPALPDYPWIYPTAGSSEGLFHILVHEKCKGKKRLYVLEGEYEGAGALAEKLGYEVFSINLDHADIQRLPEGLWYISNPSAREGNIIPNDLINKIADTGQDLLLDLAYVGTTKPYLFDISHKQIKHIVISLSKPFGLFRFRIGCALSRSEVPTLYGNRWFKDISRIIQGLAVVETLGIELPWNHYSGLQEQIVKELRVSSGLALVASDAYLLANLKLEQASKRQGAKLEIFRRANKYRFCLTPFFELYERHQLLAA